MESAPGNTRGFFAALVSSGAAAGTVLGAGAAFAVGTLPQEDLLAWGWRVPFLASALIFAVSFYVRMKVEESPSFQRAVARAAPERVPLLAVLQRCKVATLQVLFCAMAESSTFYFTSVFGPVLRHPDAGPGQRAAALGRRDSATPSVSSPIPRSGRCRTGSAASRCSARRTCSSAAYVLTVFFPMLLANEARRLVMLAMAIPGAILQPMSLAVSGSFYPERFDDPRLRLSGVSLGRQLGTILGGGVMPMIAASLLAWSGGSLTWVLAYFAAVCTLAVGAVLSSRETAGGSWAGGARIAGDSREDRSRRNPPCPRRVEHAGVDPPTPPRFGITRVANITGLDRIGIPVWICVRPLGRSLSVAQGKGLTSELAEVSAVMESIECHHAEHVAAPDVVASYRSVRRGSTPWIPRSCSGACAGARTTTRARSRGAAART